MTGAAGVVAWTLVAAAVGRMLLPGIKPGLGWATACAALGFVVCFVVARAALGVPEVSLFAPECAVPAAAVTTMLLWVVRRVVFRRGTIFF